MFNEVKELLTKQLRLKDVEITPASRIKDDLGADSLDILQLLMTIEEITSSEPSGINPGGSYIKKRGGMPFR